MKGLNLFLIIFTTLIALGCTAGEQSETAADSEYPNAQLLISASELSDRLADSDSELLLVDARSETEGGVIPGAVHFPAVSSLVDEDHPIDSYLVGADRFQELMRGIGLDQNDNVVIYDDGNALAAARLFYALDYYGFSNASILNGGIQAWNEMNGTLSDSASTPQEGTFEASAQETLMCDFDYVVEASQADNKVIFDVRSEEEYTGEVERAAKSGHIPNAAHMEWSNVLESEGVPYFLPADSIQVRFSSQGITPDKEIIPHCQSNVRGSHAYFTLRLMGYDSVRPYEGSWADYGNREGATVVQ